MVNIKNEKTTLQVNKKTLDRLKKCRMYRRDTYEELLNRLIDKWEETK